MGCANKIRISEENCCKQTVYSPVDPGLLCSGECRSILGYSIIMFSSADDPEINPQSVEFMWAVVVMLLGWK